MATYLWVNHYLWNCSSGGVTMAFSLFMAIGFAILYLGQQLG